MAAHSLSETGFRNVRCRLLITQTFKLANSEYLEIVNINEII